MGRLFRHRAALVALSPLVFCSEILFGLSDGVVRGFRSGCQQIASAWRDAPQAVARMDRSA
ncbi:hypothetical protein AFFFEF_04143 [Methylorubrum extorquens]